MTSSLRPPERQVSLPARANRGQRAPPGVTRPALAAVACAPVTIAAIPSPSTAVWQLGPIPVRAYALCIILGIAVACAVTEVRLRRRGGPQWAVLDIALWAVLFGMVGARLYHVITSPQDYFGEGGEPIRALYIWEGGLGIWGAVAGGVLGGWLAARQLGIPFTVVADAAAPGLPLAQAVGRIGNWFNNELYGGHTDLPWGLDVHQMDPDNPGEALKDQNGDPILEPGGPFHPTFLYEALWNVGVAGLVIWADRKWKFGKGRAFALYVMAYTVGRFWIELMRTDEANKILGVRLNVFTSVVVFLGALIYFLRVRGSQEFLVPVDAPVGVVAPVGAGGADVSQRDVSGESGTAARKPQRYRAVTEEQYRAYQETGVVPEEKGDLLDDFADDDVEDEPDDDVASDGVGDDPDAGSNDGSDGGETSDEESDDESDTDARGRADNGGDPAVSTGDR
ncbi:prolipoprotein diacylglyceryl transferase [Micromonospora sp. CPCC 205371]|nr:prolipoprotein diacylglyceryl transferase [Micromonospora sp. CPCC 205371]